MSANTKWVLRILGAVLAFVSAVSIAFQIAPAMLIVTVPLVFVWVFWLVYDYLQWARSLGEKSE